MYEKERFALYVIHTYNITYLKFLFGIFIVVKIKMWRILDLLFTILDWLKSVSF